jgi:pyruvate/2-oxoglutarate dehydrogenase complex dihydrolipoamide acyltransferase (E2) component
MAEPSINAVTIPLVNPNESVALLASLHVKEGQKISKGDVLCTLETTKSILDMVAEEEGFIVDLRFKAGENVEAGDTLCYITSSLDIKPEPSAIPSKKKAGATLEGLPNGLRITQPALVLAKELLLDLSIFPIGPLVTEAMVRETHAANTL